MPVSFMIEMKQTRHSSSSSINRLLPPCYQDRTTQPHLAPCQERSALWFLVGLGCLRLDSWNFVNRRSLVRFQSPAPDCEATGAEPMIRISELRGFEGDVSPSVGPLRRNR